MVTVAILWFHLLKREAHGDKRYSPRKTFYRSGGTSEAAYYLENED
jgi:hypothetical protein